MTKPSRRRSPKFQRFGTQQLANGKYDSLLLIKLVKTHKSCPLLLSWTCKAEEPLPPPHQTPILLRFVPFCAPFLGMPRIAYIHVSKQFAFSHHWKKSATLSTSDFPATGRHRVSFEELSRDVFTTVNHLALYALQLDPGECKTYEFIL